MNNPYIKFLFDQAHPPKNYYEHIGRHNHDRNHAMYHISDSLLLFLVYGFPLHQILHFFNAKIHENPVVQIQQDGRDKEDHRQKRNHSLQPIRYGEAWSIRIDAAELGIPGVESIYDQIRQYIQIQKYKHKENQRLFHLDYFRNPVSYVEKCDFND